MKRFRFKKDVRIYHPHYVEITAGSVVIADREPIIVDENAVVITNDEKIREYMEEVENV